MKCSHCGEPLNRNASFCPKCGTEVSKEPHQMKPLYSSKGCPSSIIRMNIVLIAFAALFCAVMFGLSYATRNDTYIRQPTAEERAANAANGNGAVLGGVFDTRPVDVFSSRDKVKLQAAGVVVVLVGIGLGLTGIKQASACTTTVYIDRIEGTPYGLRPAKSHAVIEVKDIASVSAPRPHLNALVIIGTKSNYKETFMCRDAKACVKALQDAQSANQRQ